MNNRINGKINKFFALEEDTKFRGYDWAVCIGGAVLSATVMFAIGWFIK